MLVGKKCVADAFYIRWTANDQLVLVALRVITSVFLRGFKGAAILVRYEGGAI